MRAVLLALLAACATTSATTSTPPGGPRGLRASEHLDVARTHDQIAKDENAWPDPRPDATGALPMAPGQPWLRSWDADSDHERIAAYHRGKAAEIHAEYDEACAGRTAEQAAASPLARYATGGWPTSTGVIVYLSPLAGDPDKLVADMRCHRAWMMLQPQHDMDDCPLDLPGIAVDARGDREGITLSISVRDPKFVDELHRRAEHELETGRQLH